MTSTFCPDCGRDIPSDLFVSHREQEHPPTPLAVSAAGAIRSETRFGTDPPDHDTEE